MSDCPCGSGTEFESCCGAILAGQPATTAEALMRSRYTAFVRGDLDYLDRTLAPEKRADVDRRQVERSARDAQAAGLDVRAIEGGGPDDQDGTVEYLARFRIRDQNHVHHELATFRREDGAWVYVDGKMNPNSGPRQASKVGRNDPCPCGSGKKFKKCCGA